MKNSIKLKILYFKESFYKSLFATLLFILVYQFSTLEFIRANIENISFDIFNKLALENKSTTVNAPNILLFKIDDFYLKEHRLIENGKTNYGYLFPRDKLASFIHSLDENLKYINKKRHPKALFIDYDFSYTSMVYNQKLSKEDEYLLDTLKQDREYTILLPKTNNFNFIEKSNDIQIQKLIQEKKIVFVSVKFIESSDNKTRRYLPFADFSNTTYPHAMLTLWQYIKTNKLSQKISDIKNINDIENRIIFKKYREKINENLYETYLSYWNNFFVYSANYPFDEIVEENFHESIILLGGTHSNSNDSFDVNSMNFTETLSGIELHANALMTMLYLDGQMKKFNFWISVLILFIVFFCVSYIVELLFYVLGFEKQRILAFVVLLVISTVIMFFISYIIFEKYQQWFNWFVPVILFQTIELIEFIKKLQSKLGRKTNEVNS